MPARSTQHKPFSSIYRENFEVVEEFRHNTRLYPHTEQLPAISRALNLEFYGALPARIASTDHRADPFRKLLLYAGVNIFCNLVNAHRQDRVRLFPCCTPDLVAKVGILQHIITSGSLGNCHVFRIFTGDDFLPDVHLEGKRFAFASHVLDRFSSRAEHLGEHVADLLFTVVHTPGFRVKVGRSVALAFQHQDSMIALPLEDHGAEYFFTTCLTPKEINSLDIGEPCVMHFHFDAQSAATPRRNFDCAGAARAIYEDWKNRKPFATVSPADVATIAKGWRLFATHLKDIARKNGYTEQTYLEFLDNIYGPAILYRNAGPKPSDRNDRAPSPDG